MLRKNLNQVKKKTKFNTVDFFYNIWSEPSAVYNISVDNNPGWHQLAHHLIQQKYSKHKNELTLNKCINYLSQTKMYKSRVAGKAYLLI